MNQEKSILKAVERLKLPRCASVRQIQKRYHELAKEHHSDRQKGVHDNEMAGINEAYAILMDYCRNYKICFDEKPVKENPRDCWKQQFGDSL